MQQSLSFIAHLGLSRLQRGKKAFLLLTLISIFFLAGCAQTKDVTAIQPLEDPVAINPKPQSPGTIWNGDEGNWISDVKGRRVGDIVTVTISEQAKASKQATTNTDRASSLSAGITDFFGLTTWLAENNNNLNQASMINAKSDNKFSGTGKTTRAEDLVATLTTQIVETYPNGNLKIRGGKSVTVNNENQIIYLTGIVRPYDITADNKVDSQKILNAQISYTGKGVVSDVQSPGWLSRIFSHTWPF